MNYLRYLAQTVAIILMLISNVSMAAADAINYQNTEELRKTIIEKLSKSPLVVRVVADPNDSENILATLREANGDQIEVKAYVGNLLGRLRIFKDASPEEEVDRFVSSVLEIVQKAPLDTSRLYANIRHKNIAKNIDASRWIHYDFLGETIVVYQFSDDSSIHSISEADLNGITAEHLKEFARNNINREFQYVSMTKLGETGMYYSLDNEPDFTPALLLSDAFWKKIDEQYQDGAYVIIPRRDQLMVYDKRKPSALTDAKTMIKATVSDGVDLLSEDIFERKDGKLLLLIQ